MTNIGSTLYNYCYNSSLHLMKVNKDKQLVPNVWYYILNFTWGLIPTLLAGLLWFFIWMFKGFKSEYYYGRRYLCLGDNWGGVSLGINFMVGESEDDSIKSHELGHTYQNALLGIFVIFLGWIPSLVRYWYYKLKVRKGKKFEEGWYDSFWYEGCATNIGKYIIDYKE